MMEKSCKKDGRYSFECQFKDEKGEIQSWKGGWSITDIHGRSIEMMVTARGYSYWLIVGEYTNGYYVCLPEWNAGSALGFLDDMEWNYKRLSSSMHPTDALSVLAALQDFARTTGWGLQS